MSDSSNDNIVDQNRLSDYEWEAEADERSESIQNLITKRMNEYVNRWVRQPTHSARRPRRNIERNHEVGYNQLYNNYFMNPVYPPELFRRKFRMQKHIFMRIVEALSGSDRVFQQRHGGNGRPSFSPLQRCTAAIRVLAYCTSSDSLDEYLRMSDIAVRDSLKSFVEGVMHNFGNENLCRPNPHDLTRLLHMDAVRGFPGSLNDINVLQRSPLFNESLEEFAPAVNFTVNGMEYNMKNYLSDGIYLGWATFVKSINAPQIQKHRLFAA